MPWFNVDDGLAFHPKTIKAGNAAMGLWARAGSHCAKHLTDGFVDDAIVESLGTAKQAERLVNAGLWTRVDGGYQFHEYSAEGRNRTKEQVLAERAYNARKAALHRDPALLNAVRDRDGNRCRYCGCLVDWGNRRGSTGATYDHVDPDGPNSMANLVVACRACNSRKGNRSALEAGMSLLPARSMGISQNGAGEEAAYQVPSSSEPDQNQNGTGSEPGPLHSPPLPSTGSKKKTSSSSRGTRIPETFAVTADMVEWARVKTPNVDGRRETEKFINYWQAASGQKAVKRDWAATWRNWMLNAEERAPRLQQPFGSPAGRPSTTDARVAAVLALARPEPDNLLELPGTAS